MFRFILLQYLFYFILLHVKPHHNSLKMYAFVHNVKRMLLYDNDSVVLHYVYNSKIPAYFRRPLCFRNHVTAPRVNSA